MAAWCGACTPLLQSQSLLSAPPAVFPLCPLGEPELIPHCILGSIAWSPPSKVQ